MHILITADTLGGVWTYTQELVKGLASAGVKVTLVSFGDIPSSEQTRWMESVRRLDYRPTAFKLEWMQNCEEDMESSSAYLCDIVREIKPDLLHFSQYYYGALPCTFPAWWWPTVMCSAGGQRFTRVFRRNRHGCAGTVK